jgi:uncharacterized protein with FMN-binding domain
VLRRIVTVVIASIGGLALLASFHTTPGTASKSALSVVAPTRPPAGGSAPNRGSTTPTTGPSSVSVPATPSTASPASRTITGPVVSNRYGNVEVEIVVAGSRLVDVEALVLPSDRRRSQEISSIAGPELRQEALQAGSAQIDGVSGATYTSESYAQSLQAAIDRVGA